jgi:hypothetical protein
MEDPGYVPYASRVWLEPVMMRNAALGDDEAVEIIRAELASRVWQGLNPYA